MTAYYASLIGPLRGLYYPIPDELDTDELRRAGMFTSRLKDLWHSIYPAAEVQRQVAEFGGTILPDDFARRLDYDSHKVNKVRYET